MAQFQVLKYTLLVGTAPVGAGAPEFITGVTVDIQTTRGPQQMKLPINGPMEFMAVCALIQAPGALFLDDQLLTLEKVGP